MKLSLFICFVLCCATLVSSGQTWKTIQEKLKKDVQPYTDFVHVVSSQNQVTSGDFTYARRAAVLLTQGVDELGGQIGNNYSKLAFVQFSLSVYNEYELGWYQNLGYVQNRINNLPRRPGDYAAVGIGLIAARNQFYMYPSQSQKNKVVWLVTNRFSEAGTDAETVADQLKASGVKVYVIGIGKINRWKELEKLASKGRAFHFNTYMEYMKAVLDAINNL